MDRHPQRIDLDELDYPDWIGESMKEPTKYEKVESATDKGLVGLAKVLTTVAESPWSSVIIGGTALGLIVLLIVLA